MKKILIIWLVVALTFSMVSIVKQANANTPEPTFDSNTVRLIPANVTDDYNLMVNDIYNMVDFYDYAHGKASIQGTIYGYNPYNENYSTYPLSKASISIRMFGQISDFVTFVNKTFKINKIDDDDIKIINVTKLNITDSRVILNNWSYSDDVIVNINSSVEIEGLNFSSLYNCEPYYSENTNIFQGFTEKEIIINPGSEINYETEELTQYTKLWRFTFSDENGEYEFDFLQPGTYEIEVKKVGYETSTRVITVGGGASTEDFLLKGINMITAEEIVITPFNDSIKKYREISGPINTRNIDNAIINEKVGCEIIVEKNHESHVVVYNNGFRINSTNIEGNKISLKISGEEHQTGKTVVVNVEGDFFDDHLNLLVNYDQETIRLADDLDDVLNPDDDGSHPEYLIIQGAEGTQILVSIPHFSEHEITIYSQISETIAGLDMVTIIALYAVICTIATVVFIGCIGIRKKIR